MEIELTRIWRAMRRFWWVAVSAAVVFAILGALVASSLSQAYVAKSTVLVLPSTVGEVSISQSSTPIQTYVELVESDSVLTQVIENTNPDLSVADLRARITVTSVPNASIIRVAVTDPDPDRAVELANAVTETFTVSAEAMVNDLLQEKQETLVAEQDQTNSELDAVNASIGELTSSNGELSSDDANALQSQRAEKLRLEQRRSDINAELRALEGTILNSQTPLVVTQAADRSASTGGVSTMLVIAAMGVLGAVVGTGLMLWLELRDPNVRDEDHLRALLGTDSVTRVQDADESVANSPGLKLAGARIAGLARSTESSNVVFVTPRENESLRTLANAMQNSNTLAGLQVAVSHAMLDTGDGAEAVAAGTPAMLFVEASKTRNEDVLRIAEVLSDLGVHSVSATILDR